MADLKKQLDIEEFYRSLEAIPKDICFLGAMYNLVKEKAREYLPLRKEDTCLKINPPPLAPQYTITQYDETKFEYLMWMTSLISMSWLLTNVKMKTEHGHCHNKIHEERQKETGYTQCPIGSAFHAEFYNDIVNSIDHLLTYSKGNLPKTLAPNSRVG